MSDLEKTVLFLARGLWGIDCEISESTGSVKALFVDERTSSGYKTLATYFGDPQTPLTQSTKEERLKQAKKDLMIKIHNKITSLKGVLNAVNSLECESAD